MAASTDEKPWHRSSGLKGCLSVALVIILTSSASCASQEPEATTAVSVASPRTPKATFTPIPTHTAIPTVTATPTATQLPPTPTESPTATPDVVVSVSPLTGLSVDDTSLLQRRVLAARIGNDPSIRPQEGLRQAEIVFEELMDGWTLTRFTALYLSNGVERLRPLRSARLVNLAIASQYDAALVHTGASDRIRWLISQASFVDLDQYFHPEPYSVLPGHDWRGRMYSSTERIRAYLRKKGWERGDPIEGYRFDPTPPKGAPATSIHIPYPELCTVEWGYAPETGQYLRSVQGEAHLDGLTGEQIAAANVIVFYAEHKKTDIVEDSLGNTAIDIVIAGSGRAQVCRDGKVIEGRWVQSAPDKLIQYYDGSSRQIPLKPGTTWIQLVPLDYAVTIR